MSTFNTYKGWGSILSPYLKFLTLSFKEKYVYRFNFATSIIAGLIIVYIQISVWSALFGDNQSGIRQLIIYVLISSFIFNLTKSEASNKIGEKIEKGTIVTDLTKPINFRNYLFAEDIGSNIFQVLFISLPAFLFFGFQYDLSIQLLSPNLALFLLSLFFAILIAFLLKFIIGLFTFWLESSWYIPFIVGAIFELFSGSTIPLWFYPDWLLNICYYLPFRLIFFEPISIFLGKYSLVHTSYLLLLQLFWILVLLVIERSIWKRVQRKVIVHGG